MLSTATADKAAGEQALADKTAADKAGADGSRKGLGKEKKLGKGATPKRSACGLRYAPAGGGCGPALGAVKVAAHMKRPAGLKPSIVASKVIKTDGHVKQVDLKSIKVKEMLIHYDGRREAFGCLGYSLVEKTLGPKASHVVMTASRKWARAQLLKFFDAQHI